MSEACGEHLRRPRRATIQAMHAESQSTWELLAAAQEALAAAYFRTGDFDLVAAILDQARGEAEAAHDLKAQAAVVDRQGLLMHYRAIERPADERETIDVGPELALFERALDIRRQIGDTEGLPESFFHLGLVHQVLRSDGEAAIPYFREALEMVEAHPEADVLLRSEIHRHVGFDLFLREHRYEQALLHLGRSLELRRLLPETGWVVSGLIALAMGERLAGMRSEAIDHSRQALELARKEGLRERHVLASESSLRAAEQAG